MGKRGPKPTPTAALALRGSWRAKSRPSEPKPSGGKPRVPAWLPNEAKTIWKALIPILAEMRVLTTADGFALSRFCTSYARWQRLVLFLAENGETADDHRVKRLRPEVRIASNLADQISRLEQQFGLTPSARASLRMELSKREEPDPLTDRKARYRRTAP